MISNDQLKMINAQLLGILEDVLDSRDKRFLHVAANGMTATLAAFQALIDEFENLTLPPHIDLGGNPLDEDDSPSMGPSVPPTSRGTV